MILQVLAAVAEWLEDADTGPNAYLAGVGLEPDDAALELAPIVAVFHPYRDRAAFAFEEPGRYPSLFVNPAGPVAVEGEVNQDEQNGDSLQVAVRVLVNNITSPETLRRLDYYLTAINRSVSAFLASDAAGEAARTRGHVQIIACLSRSYALADEEIGQAKVGAILLLNLSIRDIGAT